MGRVVCALLDNIMISWCVLLFCAFYLNFIIEFISLLLFINFIIIIINSYIYSDIDVGIARIIIRSIP